MEVGAHYHQVNQNKAVLCWGSGILRTHAETSKACLEEERSLKQIVPPPHLAASKWV